MMSRFSNTLEDVIARYAPETATEFAARSGISQSTISRILRDETIPDKATLGKLCAAVSEEEACSLLLARTVDSLPADFGHLVHCAPAGPRLREAEALPEVFGKLSRERRLALEHLALLCLKDEELADLVVRSVKKLRGL